MEEFFEFQMDVLTGKKTRDAAHAAFMDKMVRDELAFAGNGKIYSVKPAGDTLAVANRVMNTHREMLDALSAEEKHSSGSPWELQQGSPLQFDVTDQVTASGTYTATFQWKNGPSALKIHSVRLYEGNREVASDVHEGRTGVENKDNIYRLELKKYRTNLDSYILKAEVSGVSQGASKGEMVLKNWWIEKWTGSCAGMGEKAVIRAGFSICFGISLFPSPKKGRRGGFSPLSSLKDGMVIKFIGGGVTIER